MIHLSRTQRGNADRAQGIELMVLWPGGLPEPRLAEDDERLATPAEWAAARQIMGIPSDAEGDILIRGVRATVVRRPLALRTRRGELAAHLAIELVTRRWYGALNRPGNPVVMWHDPPPEPAA